MRNLLTSRRALVAGAVTAGLLAAGVAPAAAAPVPLDSTDAAPQRVILNPTQDPATSQTVTWRSVGTTADVPATAELRTPDGQVVTVDAVVTSEKIVIDGAQAITYSATFTDLTPGTEYAYRVLTGEVADDWHTFTTGSASDDPFTFTWYGDGQNDLTEKWTPIVGLAKQAFPNSELTLQSGDLINHSVESEWEEWFTITDGERQTENWLPAIGNHEYSSDTVADYWNASFTVPKNGPEVPENAPANRVEHMELVADHLANRVYYTDYQGVRFIALNSHLRNQNQLQEAAGVTLPEIPSSEFRDLYLGMQADWLDEVLDESTANWNVIQFHHPTFSVSSGRDNAHQRAAFLPVIKANDVDLVLSGHDHTYARGFLDADATSTPGVTSGTVFAVTNSGPKHYNLAPDSTNVWLNNDATQVVKYQHVSFIQGMRVTPDTLEYEAIVAQRGGNNPNTDLEIGETADSFTISRLANGTTAVTEGIERRVATGLGQLEMDPVDGDIVLEADVPAGDPALEQGALTMTIAADSTVDLGDARNGGDRWSFDATLPQISVTDTRTAAAGWSLTGSTEGLTSPAGAISSAFLGWAPRVLGAATADAGPQVLGQLDGGQGLTEAMLLARADDHARFGTTEVVADLALDVPVDTPEGSYAGAVNVRLFPVD